MTWIIFPIGFKKRLAEIVVTVVGQGLMTTITYDQNSGHNCDNKLKTTCILLLLESFYGLSVDTRTEKMMLYGFIYRSDVGLG